MDYQALLHEVKNEFALFVKNIEAAGAMSLFDTHRVAEKIILPLFREIMGWPHLRNLNAEVENHPAIDLGDSAERVGIQVSATNDLDKVKTTLDTFFRHKLDAQYDRVIVYVLTHKQNSYKQKAIDKVVAGRMPFNASKDVLDFTDLLKEVANLEDFARVAAVRDIFKRYRLAGDPISRPAWLLRTEVSLDDIPAFTPRWLFFAERKIPLLGRQDDMAALEEFIQGPEQFSWWAVCGPAGIGKTRLAHELELKFKSEWYCGFIDAKSLPTEDQLQQLQRPALLVFDYAARDSEALRVLLKKCCALNGSLTSKVRLLLLEREANENADWWKELFQPESVLTNLFRNHLYRASLELCALNAQAGDILRAWLQAGAPEVVEKLPPSGSDFWEQVTQVSEGRPLLIALIAGAFSRAPDETQVPALRDLLSPVLQREAERWKSSCTDASLFPGLVQLLAVATLVRGLDILREDHRVLVYTGGEESQYLLFKDPRTQVLRIPTVGDLMGNEEIFALLNNQQQNLWDNLVALIPAAQLTPTIKLALEACPPRGILQPDLIGEFFIDELWGPQLPFSPATALPGLSNELLESVLTSAWTLHPRNLLETLEALKKTTTSVPGYLRLLEMLTAVACKTPANPEYAPILLARLLYNAMIRLGRKKSNRQQAIRVSELLATLTQSYPNDREVAYRQFKALAYLVSDPVTKQNDIDRARSVNQQTVQFITDIAQHPQDRFELYCGDVLGLVAIAAMKNHHEEMLAEALQSAQALQANFGASTELNALLTRFYAEVAHYLAEPQGDPYTLSSERVPLARRCLPLISPQLSDRIDYADLDQPSLIRSTWALINVMYGFAKLELPAPVLELHLVIARCITKVTDPSVALAMTIKSAFNAQTAYLLENNLPSALALFAGLKTENNIPFSDEASAAYLQISGRTLSLLLEARSCDRFLEACDKLFALYPLMGDDETVVWMFDNILRLIRDGFSLLSLEASGQALFSKHLPTPHSQWGRCTDLFVAYALAGACMTPDNEHDHLKKLERLFIFVTQHSDPEALFECLHAALLRYWLSVQQPRALTLFDRCEITMASENTLRIRITADDLSLLNDETLTYFTRTL